MLANTNIMLGKRMHLPLKLHPDCRCDAVDTITVGVERGADGLSLRYEVAGRIADLLLPAWTLPARADGLWQHSCFEAFVRQGEGEAYAEFNFAPSTEWAAYRFAGYRSGMEDLDVAPPSIETHEEPARYELRASIGLPRGSVRLGLSAVIEERSGRKSYWALAHPAAKPDFHHPDAFTCELA